MLWLGLFADAFGFESLYMECWRIREEILDMFEMATGGRVIFSIMKVGGLRRDIPDDMLKHFRQKLDSIEEGAKIVSKPFIDDVAVKSRLAGVGILTPEKAELLGTAGPFLRASGISRDIRTTGYCAYGDVDFEPIVSTEGDSYARTECRIKEIFQAFDIIRQLIDHMPSGDIDVPVKGMPNGEYVMRIEQPRGEAIYYVKANGTKFIDRMRVRTPTFANLSGLVETLKGCDLADVPILVLTIDPCISCTER
jgi:ech hydrogenase subunit E